MLPSRVVVAAIALSSAAAQIAQDCRDAYTTSERFTACSDNTTECRANSTQCQAFIESMTDAAIDDMITGFANCTNDSTAVTMAAGGADYYKKSVIDKAHRCGLADNIALTQPGIDTCAGVIIAVTAALCPKQCGDANEGLTACTPGQEDRGPASCGDAACRDFIVSFDDAKLASMKAGAAACNMSVNPASAMLDPSQTIAAMGIRLDGYMFQIFMNSLAKDCGHDDEVTWSWPSMDTCMGVYSKIMDFDEKCPKKCDSDDRRLSTLDGRRLDGRRLSSLRDCADGEEEHNSSSCGASAAPQCEALLRMFDDNMDDVVTGLESCSGELASFQDSAQMMPSYIGNITEDCGYDFDPPSGGPGGSPGGSGGSGGTAAPGDASQGPSALMCISRLALLLLALVGISLN